LGSSKAGGKVSVSLTEKKEAAPIGIRANRGMVSPTWRSGCLPTRFAWKFGSEPGESGDPNFAGVLLCNCAAHDQLEADVLITPILSLSLVQRLMGGQGVSEPEGLFKYLGHLDFSKERVGRALGRFTKKWLPYLRRRGVRPGSGRVSAPRSVWVPESSPPRFRREVRPKPTSPSARSSAVPGSGITLTSRIPVMSTLLVSHFRPGPSKGRSITLKPGPLPPPVTEDLKLITKQWHKTIE
jgi:hypothetical protein